MSAPAVETEGLGRDHGTTRALDALSIRIPAGAFVGLLGPNGAGKTTTMLLLATLLAPTRGSARIFGHDTLRERRRVRKRLGLVFQEPSVDGLLTVEENLRFATRLAGLGAASGEAAVRQTIERTGLRQRARQPARQLSGGWRRLLDIARATLHQPELLILDEPTVGLDPEHRERMWALLESERRERGVTVLFSTHYLSEAEPSDRVVMLAGGRVVADDRPAALCASIGEEVAEIEGDGAKTLVGRLEAESLARSVQRTERGWRVGLASGRARVSELAAETPGVSRFALRPPALEDVYFARTQA
ncbi:MAG TPA: ABC transporter ATP-binding protein [Gemmatimonadales bacterium]|nr:ABC transporter ATP-binding protein [Gemmatimonadales bacterium]